MLFGIVTLAAAGDADYLGYFKFGGGPVMSQFLSWRRSQLCDCFDFAKFDCSLRFFELKSWRWFFRLGVTVLWILGCFHQELLVLLLFLRWKFTALLSLVLLHHTPLRCLPSTLITFPLRRTTQLSSCKIHLRPIPCCGHLRRASCGFGF